MRLTVLSFILIFALCVGCKSAPLPVQEEEPGPLVLLEDEVKIINEVNEHVLATIMRELKNTKDDMQACVNTEFYLQRPNSKNSYEDDLVNAEKFLRNELRVENDMVLSFIGRNKQKRDVDKNIKFIMNFFWKGGTPKRDYFKITYSSIGFDKTSKKAIVYVYVDLPGWVYTEYVYLEKQDEDWKYKSSKVDYRHSLY